MPLFCNRTVQYALTSDLVISDLVLHFSTDNLQFRIITFDHSVLDGIMVWLTVPLRIINLLVIIQALYLFQEQLYNA